MWAEKHAPVVLDQVAGNPGVLKRMGDWAREWENGARPKPLLLYGPPGVGKSASCRALAESMGFELLEVNASDERNKAALEKLANSASTMSISGRRRLLVLDEIDGLNRYDRGAGGVISKLLKESRNPVLLVANDYWSQKLKSFRKLCEALQFKHLVAREIASVLARIAREEGVVVSEEVLLEFSADCGGDLRAAITDLEAASLGRKRVGVDDLLAGDRNREKTLFYAMRDLFGAEGFYEARHSVDDVSEQPDFVEKWVDENIPLEFSGVSERAAAFEKLSKADVFFGRTFSRQYYGLWRYALDFLTAGVCLAREGKKTGFVKYAFPSMIRKLSQTMVLRAVRDKLASRAASKLHTSKRRVVSDDLFLLRVLFGDFESAAKLSLFFGFEESEIGFLGQDSEKVLERAGEISKESVLEKLEKKGEATRQTRLGSF